MAKPIQDLERQKFNEDGAVRVSDDSKPKPLLYAEESSTVFYVGEGQYGALPSEAKWKISRIEASGDFATIKYASEDFDQVWNDRENLTYV